MSVQDIGSYPMIQAAKYTPRERQPGDIRFIVIHTMEGDQGPGVARNVAEWFASDASPDASAHLMIDPYEVIRGVHDKDWAWHADRANGPGIGIEHAGWSDKTDWSTPESQAELSLSAKAVAKYCKALGIPPVWLSPQDILDGKRGITGHRECNLAYAGGRGHVDPGESFPRQAYVSMVRKYLFLENLPKIALGALAVGGIVGLAYYAWMRLEKK